MEEQFEEKNNNETWYCIEKMGAYELYNALCEKCNFGKMILLYKLIKYKMEFLEDETRNYCNGERENNENSRY